MLGRIAPEQKGELYTSLHGTRQALEHAALGERHRIRPRNDQMIEQSDLDQRERIAQSSSDHLIGPARLGDPGGVIVYRDDRCRIVGERLAQHFAWVDGRTVERATE